MLSLCNFEYQLRLKLWLLYWSALSAFSMVVPVSVIPYINVILRKNFMTNK